MTGNVQLILGGARSGKSRYAETLAVESDLPVIYVATSNRHFTFQDDQQDDQQDEEMLARIEHHQNQRPSHWQTVEEPLDLAGILKQHSQKDNCLLVDCLTLWLTNHLLKDESLQGWQQAKQELLDVLPSLPGQVLLVSNEVGQGVVPLGKISRQFVDQAGWLHQEITQIADGMTFVTAGIPQKLK